MTVGSGQRRGVDDKFDELVCLSPGDGPVVSDKGALMLSVLLVAYNCDPRHNSESRLGWRRFETLRASHDVHVTLVTAESNRERLELLDLGHNSKVVFVDNHRALLSRLPGKLGQMAGYSKFLRKGAGTVASLCRARSFDVAHQLPDETSKRTFRQFRRRFTLSVA